MKVNQDPYTILGWFAVLTVPLAPAFYFGFSFATDVYTMVAEWSGVTWLAVLIGVGVGIFGAGGLEAVGVLSGHNAIRFWDAGKKFTAAACILILFCYVGLGIAGLENALAKGTVMFLVAPLVYLLVGMQSQFDKVERNQNQQERQSLAIGLRQQDAAANRQHQLDMERLRLEAEVKKERIRQPKTKVQPDTTEKVLKVSGKVSEDEGSGRGGFTHWRNIPHEIKLSLHRLSPEEILANNPTIHPRTAGNWIESSRKLSQNGVGKHAGVS